MHLGVAAFIHCGTQGKWTLFLHANKVMQLLSFNQKYLKQTLAFFSFHLGLYCTMTCRASYVDLQPSQTLSVLVNPV